jgi:lipopolysaccharide transport system permease protein
LIKKVYFPRLIVPIASVLDGLVDFGVSMLLLLGLMALYGFAPTLKAAFLPVLVVFALATALSVGIWLSAVNVRYRDVRYTVPFLSQLWMYASPVAYSITIIPARWRWVYALNPMVGVIEGFRWALIGREAPDLSAMMVSLAVVLTLLLTGVVYFRRMESSFADVI